MLKSIISVSLNPRLWNASPPAIQLWRDFRIPRFSPALEVAQDIMNVIPMVSYRIHLLYYFILVYLS